MKAFFTALWKIIVLTIVYFIVNAIVGVLMPLSNDMMAAMTAEDQAAFFPLFFLNIFINMTVMYLVLLFLRFKGWKLFLLVWVSIWGLFSVMNCIELYWFNESFPLYSYMDVTKIIISALISYGVAALIGTLLVGGFKREEAPLKTTFLSGKFGWRIILFCIIYPLFYYLCGFIPWTLFPQVREFYAGWAMTSEPIYVLLLFNVFRGALWFLFSLPIILGVQTRNKGFWLLPLVHVTGTAIAVIIPSAVMPPMVRLGHFIELTISMGIIGVFMIWLFVQNKKETVS